MSRLVPPPRGILVPLNVFMVGGKRLYLYVQPNRVSHPYSLYWELEENPVQHGCSEREIFDVLAQELQRAAEAKPEVEVKPKGVGGKRKVARKK